MRIKVTEIEANAEELRQSQPLSSSFTQMLRRAFTPPIAVDYESEEEEEEEGENE